MDAKLKCGQGVEIIERVANYEKGLSLTCPFSVPSSSCSPRPEFYTSKVLISLRSLVAVLSAASSALFPPGR